MLNSKALAASASAPKTYVEDVFSTWLYTGNSSTQTITNGIDLSGKGGLTWIKGRNATTGHRFVDTARGATKSLDSSSTSPSPTESTGLTSFSNTGFSIGADADYNTNAATYASWTFRKAEKFFDIVTYTGNGANRTIAHDLGSVPGCIIVKRTDTTGDWQVYHRSIGNTAYMALNGSSGQATSATRWNNTTPTSTVFSLGTDATVNASGGTYVAYLFAHDAGGFGDSGSDSVIQCGSLNHTNGTNTAVNLGWEPQFIIARPSNITASWYIVDSLRGLTADQTAQLLYANVSNPEDASPSTIGLTSTGFTLNYLWPTTTWIYIAIRRGPMKTPTDATKVFSSVTQTTGSSITPAYVTGFPVDMAFRRATRNSTGTNTAQARLTGATRLFTTNTNAEGAESDNTFDYMDGWFKEPSTTTNNIAWSFRRAPGFFDVVAYTGTGSARTVSHNLGVAPEMMIIKHRSDLSFTASNRDWAVYLSVAGGVNKYMFLNRSDLQYTGGGALWNNTAPTSSVFSLDGNVIVNYSAATYIAYLFATCPGVSKVGSYTGTGTTLSIDCGFTNGARFVLIKRTDSTGNWYVWDTARGIVSGNDPYLLLNSTAAEVTNTDYIDPLSSGFQISSTAPAAINANGGSFIYLAVA